MNFNALIAVLVLKGVLTKDEGEKLVEHLNNKPQSTSLADMVEQVKEFVVEAKAETKGLFHKGSKK
jgi:polyhydroxyalkanoate synthesis regulator phasin